MLIPNRVETVLLIVHKAHRTTPALSATDKGNAMDNNFITPKLKPFRNSQNGQNHRNRDVRPLPIKVFCSLMQISYILAYPEWEISKRLFKMPITAPVITVITVKATVLHNAITAKIITKIPPNKISAAIR